MTINISRECMTLLKNRNIDYCLNKVLGYVNNKRSAEITNININRDSNKMKIKINDDTYSNVEWNFQNIKSKDDVIEMLLWFYIIVGENL